MASSHSLYALYVNTRDASFGRYGS